MSTKLLLSYFKSAKKIWDSSQKELLEVRLGEKMVAKFLEHRNKFDVEKYFLNLKKESVNAVTINDSDYPVNLKDLEDTSFVL
jgi:predicted Rossmann fold nucleotide-binding protein DprA/Smf involved in DNA uptake